MSALANILATRIMNYEGILGTLINTYSATIASDSTFSPIGQVQPGVNRWVDRQGGIPIAYPSVDFSLRQPINGSRMYKIMQRVRFPVLEVTSGGTGSGYVALPKVAYTLQETREILIPEAALLADRRIFWSLCQSVAADTVYASDGAPTSAVAGVLAPAVLNLDQPY